MDLSCHPQDQTVQQNDSAATEQQQYHSTGSEQQQHEPNLQQHSPQLYREYEAPSGEARWQDLQTPWRPNIPVELDRVPEGSSVVEPDSIFHENGRLYHGEISPSPNLRSHMRRNILGENV